MDEILKDLVNDPRFLEHYEPKLKELVQKEDDEIFKRPKQGCEDIRKDFRFRLGVKAGLEKIIKLNEEVRNA